MNVKTLYSRDTAQKVKSLVMEHHKWREGCINLLAAENISSPTMRQIVASDLMHRYAEYEQHDIERRWDEGARYVIEIEKLAQDLARRLFQARYADLRPISGHLAAIACILAFTKPGGATLEIEPAYGGHEWHQIATSNRVVNYKPDWIPFDVEQWNVDVDATNEKIKKLKPDIIILGSSFYIFPHPIAELRDAADNVGAKIVYDGAHVLGLIAGRQWPNPLTLNADALTASTHKTFPGPQKGIILSNQEAVWHKAAGSLYPSLTTNHHLMNVAAFAYAMAEFLEYGEAFMAQVVKNAKALGQALSEEGFDVIGAQKGFTQSHQVLLRTERYMPPKDAARAVDKANIICNKMDLQGAQGLRLGTAEVTRMGMRESEMKEIARFIKDTIIARKDPTENAAKVFEFTKDFRTIRFSFDEGMNAYKYLELK
jgi:glycine hydroxymethyltransferase